MFKTWCRKGFDLKGMIDRTSKLSSKNYNIVKYFYFFHSFYILNRHITKTNRYFKGKFLLILMIRILVNFNSKKHILNRDVRILKIVELSLASICMNYLISTELHGAHKFVVLLKNKGTPCKIILTLKSFTLLGLVSLIIFLIAFLRLFPKTSVTVKISDWTNSKMFSLSLHSFSKPCDLDF